MKKKVNLPSPDFVSLFSQSVGIWYISPGLFLRGSPGRHIEDSVWYLWHWWLWFGTTRSCSSSHTTFMRQRTVPATTDAACGAGWSLWLCVVIIGGAGVAGRTVWRRIIDPRRCGLATLLWTGGTWSSSQLFIQSRGKLVNKMNRLKLYKTHAITSWQKI